MRASYGRGFAGGEEKPREANFARASSATGEPPAPSCEELLVGDRTRRPALQERVPGGEGRGEMRSGRYRGWSGSPERGRIQECNFI